MMTKQPNYDYYPNQPLSYDSLHFPYLKSTEFTCSDLEKYMTQQDQSTIKLTHNVPKKIGVITDCNIKFQEELLILNYSKNQYKPY